MNRLFSMIRTAALGAGLMYFFDPQSGRRRRAMVRDRVRAVRNQADNAIETGVRDLRNRAIGIRSELSARLSTEQASDQVLAERARSKLGFLTRNNRAIQIDVMDGWLYLNGDVLSSEADRVLKGLAKVRGIKGVENRLNVHEDEGEMEYQGREMLTGGMWAPSTRLLAGIGGLWMLLRGRRGGPAGWLYSLGGFALGIRALTNQGLKQFFGMTDTGATIDVMKSININVPVDEVYALWSNFETFPQFMSHVREISTSDDGTSHWVVAGPAGMEVEFDTVVTDNVPDEFIAWQTVPGSMVKHQGVVEFRETGEGKTLVEVHMVYTPPAGAIGHAVAALFGTDPKQAMDDDLVRLKSLLEHGKTSAEGQTVRQEDLNSA